MNTNIFVPLGYVGIKVVSKKPSANPFTQRSSIFNQKVTSSGLSGFEPNSVVSNDSEGGNGIIDVDKNLFMVKCNLTSRLYFILLQVKKWGYEKMERIKVSKRNVQRVEDGDIENLDGSIFVFR